MINLNVLGRPDGLGNRIEEIIIVDAYSAKKNQCINYIWNNKFDHRSYPIRITAKNINLVENHKKYWPFKTPEELEVNDFQKERILASAINIKPSFNIKFAEDIKPVGIHIRGTDRINDNGHPHFMKNIDEFVSYLSKTIDLINSKSPKYLFVCADDHKIRKLFIQNLKKDITIINPVFDNEIEREYIDFFALSLCREIYMCSKFSSFAITASMIGNIPIIAFNSDQEVAERYNALFQYEMNIPQNIKLIQTIREKYPKSKNNDSKNGAKSLIINFKNIVKSFRRKF